MRHPVSKSHASLRRHVLSAGLALLIALLGPTSVLGQSVPVGFQEYFIVGFEQHMFDMLERVYESESALTLSGGMNSVVAATASADNQIIYYDHWEDGYEADIFTPVQPTTLILGDGVDANGRACDFTTDPRIAPCNGTDDDLIFAGAFVVLGSDEGMNADGTCPLVDQRRCTVPVRPPAVLQRNPADIRFDGGDFLLTSGGPLSLIHPEDPEQDAIAGATELVSKQVVQNARSYTIPIGEDMYIDDATSNNTPAEPFKYVDVNLVAFQDGTQVTVDSPGAGGGTVSFTLNRGEHYTSRGFINLVPAPAIRITAGTRISTSGPLTGLIFTGGNGRWATRFNTLLPDLLHSTDYITTAPGDDFNEPTTIPLAERDHPLNLYIFNPDPINAIDVTTVDTSGTNVINVPPGSMVDYCTGVGGGVCDPMLGPFPPAGSTVRMNAARPFWGVSAYDYRAPDSDWGHSWLARKFITANYTVSFAPGVRNPDIESQPANRIANDPDCTIPPAAAGLCDSLNRSPLFVSATLDNTRVRVDLDNDGTFDRIDTDGDDLVDDGPNGTVVGDNTAYIVNALQALKIFDPTDYDNTGTSIVADRPIAVAYGQDTDQAVGNGVGEQDLGYAIYPIDQRFLDPVLTIDKEPLTPTVAVAGGTVTYVLEIRSFNFGPLDIEPFDLLPPELTTAAYVPGSTVITFPNLTQDTTDPALSVDAGTGRGRLDWTLPPDVLDTNQVMTIQYDIQVPPEAGVPRVLENVAHADALLGASRFSALDTARVVQTDITMTKTVDITQAEPGDVITYTIVVRNNSADDQTNTQVNDPIPLDATFVTGSVTSTGPFVGAFVPAMNAVEWNAALFPAGTTETLTFQVRINPVPPGTRIENRASCISTETPPFDSNQVETEVVGPELVLTKTGPNLAQPNEVITFEVIIKNIGDGTANNVIVADPIPSNSSYDPGSMEFRKNVDAFTALTDLADVDQGTVFADRVELRLASLGPGEDATFRFRVAVDPNTDGLFVANQAAATSDETTTVDSNLVQVPIVGNADITGHVFLDDDGNGVQDPGEPDLANVDVSVSSTVPSLYSCVPNSSIPNDGYDGTQGSMACCTITVPAADFSGTPPAITDLNVDTVLTHDFVGDLTLKLFAPGGAPVLTMLNRPGAVIPDNGANSGLTDSSNWATNRLTFDDDGTTTDAELMGSTIGDLQAVGIDDGFFRYAPNRDTAAGLTNLAGFDGLDPRGDWTLCAADSNPGNPGTFVSGTLVLTSDESPVVTQTVTTDANGDYTATVSGVSATINVDETDPDFPNGATLTTANDPQVVIPQPGATVAAGDVGYRPPELLATKTSDAAGGEVSPGQLVTYTIEVRNDTMVQQDEIAVNDPLPANTSAVPGSTQVSLPAIDTFRTTQYFIDAASFTGLTFDLTLDQALAANYFVMIRGSDGSGTDAGVRGPDENYLSLTADPFGTGALAVSSGADVITLTRQSNTNGWQGVVTVVESLGDTAASGFVLNDVVRISHGGGLPATLSGSVASAGWTDINQVMLMGGFQGAGCDTTEVSSGDNKVCHIKYVPSGANTINWTRSQADAGSFNAATSTVMVVEWGSEWTVQRVNVTGGNFGADVNAAGEYNTAALGTPVARGRTWVWGSGFTNFGGAGEGAEGSIITLGNGVVTNATETTVAVGLHNDPGNVDFEVYAITHPSLLVDHRFKPSGDVNALTVDVAVNPTTSLVNRMALAFNSMVSTAAVDPRPIFSARHIAADQVRLERRRFSSGWAAWVQSIDFEGVEQPATSFTGGDPPNLLTSADAVSLAPGNAVTITFQVRVDDPLPGGVTQITNTANASSLLLPGPFPATHTDDVILLGVIVEPNNAGFAEPGGKVTYTHAVTNTGPVADAYTITAPTELNYPVELLDPNTGAVLATDADGDGVWDGGVVISTGTLQPGESIDYRIRVSVPLAAPLDEEQTVTLIATSSRNPQLFAFATDETTVVDMLDQGPVVLNPDHSGIIQAGGTVVYTHTLVNNTGAVDRFDLSIFPGDGANWTARLFNDSNGDGVYTPGVDVEISQSRQLADGELQTLFAVVTAAGGLPPGATDVASLTAVSQTDSGLFDTATDTTTVLAAPTHDLSGGGTLQVDPSDRPRFPGTIKNLGDATDRFDLLIGPSPFFGLDGRAHPTELFIDTNADGVVDLLIATDTNGDGTWDTILPGFDTNMDGQPDVEVPGGQQLAYELVREVDPLQEAYRDPVTLTARALSTGDVDSVTATNLLIGATHVVVSDFRAEAQSGGTVVTWRTALEVGTAAFTVERRPFGAGIFTPLHPRPLPALVSAPQGGTYRFLDPTARTGGRYEYRLVERDALGVERAFGPYEARLADRPARGAVPAELWATGFTAEIHTSSVRPPVEETPRASRLQAGLQAGDEVERVRLRVRGGGLAFASAEDLATAFGTDPATVSGWLQDGQVRLAKDPAELAGCTTPDLGAGGVFGDGFESGLLCAWSGGEGVDPALFELPAAGLPWYAAADGSGLYFLAEAIDSIYTAENVYWLAKGPGVAMDELPGGSPVADPGGFYVDVLHLEEETVPLTAVIDDPESDFWFWDFLQAGHATNGQKSFPVDVAGAIAQAGGSLTVHLHGQNAAAANPDHQVLVRLNGVQLGDVRWDGAQAHTAELTIGPGVLQDGANSIELEALLLPGVSSDTVYLEAFDLTVTRAYKAQDDVVDTSRAATANGRSVLTLEGFSRDDPAVFDVTDPLSPKVVTGVTVESAGGGFRASFAASAGARYLALPLVEAEAVTVEVDLPSDLRSASNRGAYVVIAGAGLEPAAAELAAYRGGQGLAAMAVRLQDVYDEFANGVATPWAIHAFLDHARAAWDVAPRWVALAGDSAFDFKDNLGTGENLLPSPMASTPDGLFPSDNRLADFTGSDGVPEVVLGRIPARTNGELSAYVAKLQVFESLGGTWRDHTVWVADDADHGGEFEGDIDTLSALVQSGTRQHLKIDEIGAAMARQTLLSVVGDGARVVTFLGHGGLDRLADEGLMLTGDVATLTNGGRSPVLLGLTCAVGRSDVPGFDTLSETAVLQVNGGLIAVWSPTALSFNPEALALGDAFLRAAYGSGERLGDAVHSALEEYLARPDADVYLPFVFTLLGDPLIAVAP